jgi:hypothetical protein
MLQEELENIQICYQIQDRGVPTFVHLENGLGLALNEGLHQVI